MTTRYYETPKGQRYPLYEAPTRYTITVFKSDQRKAVIGDPTGCLIALGAMRDKSVIAAYIGAGKDAYLIFKGDKGEPSFALHYTINAAAARVRDYFDTHKNAKTQEIILSKPTAGRTLAHRAKLGKARRQRIKDGAEVKPRETPPARPRVMRLERLGVPYRRRAVIRKDTVSIPPLLHDADAQ